MTALTRLDPIREMSTIRNTLDRFFNERLFDLPLMWEQNRESMSLALDVAEEADKYIVKASVPGVNPEEVEITVTDNVLTIKGETKEDKDIKEENYHLRERRFGSFMRSVTLPAPVNADKIEAVHENGVITLTLPKSETVKPKKIELRKMVTAN
jgi:HSP20 family protein